MGVESDWYQQRHSVSGSDGDQYPRKSPHKTSGHQASDHPQRDLVDVVHTLKQVVCVKG
jgi:hypothetical protein